MLRVIGQASGATAQPPAGKLASDDVAVADCESLTCYFGVRCYHHAECWLLPELEAYIKVCMTTLPQKVIVTPRRIGKKG